MFFDEEQAMTACEEEPSLIFELIKEGHLELVDKLLRKKIVSVSEVDEEGNTVLMKLLKLKQYSLVSKYMTYSDFDPNHQNIEGNTFAHILAQKDYIKVAPIICKLKKNKEFSPNLKNNNGETILDLAIRTGNLCTTLKILEDRRFENIDVVSFLHMYRTFIKNKEYGKYTRLSNLEVMLSNLEKKTNLLPRMEHLVQLILNDFEEIKNEIMKNKLTSMDHILRSVLVEGKA
ncbi:MAG TPA: hypothetical protein IAC24_03950 [Candidatus Onthousia faecigallinarum]|nr:hypothetical protein [Candidatus Onthousia faecigallinarum]